MGATLYYFRRNKGSPEGKDELITFNQVYLPDVEGITGSEKDILLTISQKKSSCWNKDLIALDANKHWSRITPGPWRRRG